MGKDLEEVIRCPAFLTLSLFGRIGPRWAFHQPYCSDQAFNLTSQLAPCEERFLGSLLSQAMAAACATRGITRQQLFDEFKAQWQEGTGRKRVRDACLAAAHRTTSG
ncbi:MAG: hypothetical protein WDW36_009631 [Sanguina aurantia]